jgi:hypothetical protein
MMRVPYDNVAVFAIVNCVRIGLAFVSLTIPTAGAVLGFLQETFGFVSSSRLAR